MSTSNLQPRTFTVHYSSGQPVQPGQPVTNSFGLRGQGRLIVDDAQLTFETERRAGKDAPRLPRAEVANVDYDPEHQVFLLRTRRGDDFVALRVASRDEAEALWALLPQEKTPEFLAEREHYERFTRNMGRLGKRAPVTPAIIALNVAMFVIMLFMGADFLYPEPEILIRLGSNLGSLTWSGEPWRLLTSAFLHVGILHIVLNMYALHQGGGLVERLFGSGRYALLYLLSALAGSVVSSWWTPLGNSAGASGAIFGVYGALLAFLVVRRRDLPPRMLKSIGTSTLLFCGYSLAVGAAHPLIDNGAHVGGLLGGLVAGAILARPFDVQARVHPQPMRWVAAIVAVGVPLCGLGYALLTGGELAQARFRSQFTAFVAEDMRLRNVQETLEMTADDMNRVELAKRLRDQVQTPFRAAARPLMDAPELPADESRDSRLQNAIRVYVFAKDQALSLRISALTSGDELLRRQADEAWYMLDARVKFVNKILQEGTPAPAPGSQKP
jgi:rhomboid protease GluP